MARVVFVKSVKQVMNNNSFVRPSQINDAEKGLEMTSLTPAINAGDDYRPPEIENNHRDWLNQLVRGMTKIFMIDYLKNKSVR